MGHDDSWAQMAMDGGVPEDGYDDEPSYNYQSTSDKSSGKYNLRTNSKEMEVILTPVEFLDPSSKDQRYRIKDDADKRTVYLDVHHEENNQHDDKALQVYVGGTCIGYIQKKFRHNDHSEAVNKFCLMVIN